MNDVIYRAFISAGIEDTKEPVGLTRLDGKGPDGLTLGPWCVDKPLAWDVTAVSTLADSIIDLAAQEAGTLVEMTSNRKSNKYSVISQSYLFQPIAVENAGVFKGLPLIFLNALGRHISASSGEEHARFFSQCVCVTVQRFNVILLHH